MNLFGKWRQAAIRRYGFTVVELLFVIGIVGLFIGLLLPAVQSARDSSARVQCLNNMRQIGIALHLHHDAHGRLPPRAPNGHPNDPSTLLQWTAQILPQMEQGSLWDISESACQQDPIAYHNPPHIGCATPVRSFVCPSDPRLYHALEMPNGGMAAFASYIGIAGSPIGGAAYQFNGQFLVTPAPGVFGRCPGIGLEEITDGLSQTIMVGERTPPASLQAGRWYAAISYGAPFAGPDGVMLIPQCAGSPEDPCIPSGAGFGPGRIDNPCDRYHFWSLHSRGANFLFADGSARFFPYSAASILPALATRSGNESVLIP